MIRSSEDRNKPGSEEFPGIFHFPFSRNFLGECERKNEKTESAGSKEQELEPFRKGMERFQSFAGSQEAVQVKAYDALKVDVRFVLMLPMGPLPHNGSKGSL
jgi:hypothetical protein